MSGTFHNPSPLAVVRRRGVSIIEPGDYAIVPDAENLEFLHESISDAYLAIQREVRLYWKRFDQNAVAGTVPYTLPGDILDLALHPLRPLRIDTGSGTGADRFVYPSPRDWSYMLDEYGDFAGPWSAGALPADFAIEEGFVQADGIDVGRFLVCPPPPTDVTDGVSLHYLAHTGKLTTVILDSDESLTALVTSNSKTVTLSGTPTPTMVAGMAFGVRAVADATCLPTKWYRVQSVAGAVLTLSSVYAEATNGAAKFCVSDCSPIEWIAPGLVKIEDIANYVLADHLDRTNSDSLDDVARTGVARTAAAARMKFAAGIDRMKRQRARAYKTVPPEPDIHRSAPAIRRRSR